MKSEVKFRAWNKTRKQMVESYGHFDKEGTFHGVSTYPGSHYIPLQYTGPKDKNGKEIYAKCNVLSCKSKDGLEHRDTVDFSWSNNDEYGLIWSTSKNLVTNRILLMNAMKSLETDLKIQRF